MYNFDTSGNASVIVRATGLTNLLGVAYAEDDIVAIYENVDYQLEFNYSGNKDVTAGSKTLLNFNSMSPKCIILKPQALTHSVFTFLAAEKVSDVNVDVPIIERFTTNVNGEYFLNNIPNQSKSLFIKNESRVNQSGYIVDYTTGKVTLLTGNTPYIAMYYIQQPIIVGYKMNKTETPYFKIELVGNLNINGVSKQMIIKMPKVSLNISTAIDFESQSIAATSLDFTIINGDMQVIYY